MPASKLLNQWVPGKRGLELLPLSRLNGSGNPHTLSEAMLRLNKQKHKWNYSGGKAGTNGVHAKRCRNKCAGLGWAQDFWA